MTTDIAIATIQKNRREEMRVSLDTFNGYDLLNFRVWFDKDGKMRPGKNGIAFKVELLPEFKAAIDRAVDVARAQGLLK